MPIDSRNKVAAIESISFEKVSLQEAKAALDDRDKVVAPVIVAQGQRKHMNPEDGQLQASTLMWIESLPEKFRPRQLGLHYPRIANNLARVWQQKSACERLFDELMIDHRGKRQGFPMQVALEIMALKVHFSSAPMDNSLDWSTSAEGRVR